MNTLSQKAIPRVQGSSTEANQSPQTLQPREVTIIASNEGTVKTANNLPERYFAIDDTDEEAANILLSVAKTSTGSGHRRKSFVASSSPEMPEYIDGIDQQLSESVFDFFSLRKHERESIEDHKRPSAFNDHARYCYEVPKAPITDDLTSSGARPETIAGPSDVEPATIDPSQIMVM